MKLLTELKVKMNYNNDDIFGAIEKKYHIFRDEIENFEIVKESIDSRKKPNVFIVLNVAVVAKKNALKKVKMLNDVVVDHEGLVYPKGNFGGKRPIVVGFGPSGMFSALVLALSGANPIVLEQGKEVDERQADVDEFWKTRKLNEFSNVQFGEGGAGTFSDGKLASNVSNIYTKKCINEFVACGAPKEIFYSYAPHIGSDELKKVVKNIRKKIIENGGTILFNTAFESFETKNGEIAKVFAKNVLTNEKLEFETEALILAVGHSAENVFELLNNKKLELKQKPFAMGVRIEQSQKDINFSQYGENNKNYPSANYKLVAHLDSGRSVFTFCMCPGGYVVASSSEDGTIVTNGMSNHARDGENANSAVLVNVLPEDFGDVDSLAGVRFQKKYEKLAFELGGRNYNAPAEMVKDFLSGTDTPSGEWGKVKPTYMPGVTPANLKKCLPDFVYNSLCEALPIFNKKINNFALDDNLLIGIESRSSSPVTIVRDENLMTKTKGLFVCGEGSGYAGGITTSAGDGIKCGENVIKYLKSKI
jgi:hypothetical protein